MIIFTADESEAVSGTQEAVVVLQDVFKPSGKSTETDVEKHTKTVPGKGDKDDKVTGEEAREKKGKEIDTTAKKSPTKGKENVPDKTDTGIETSKDTEASSSRRSPEKRKSRAESDTEIPAKSPKRSADKSPGKDTGEKSPRRSLEKRKSKEGADVPSKSPRRATDKTPSTRAKSPLKQNEKAASSKLNTKPKYKSPEKVSSKSVGKEIGKRPTRKSADSQLSTAQKSPQGSRHTSAKSSEKTIEKRKAKADSVTRGQAKSARIMGTQSPRKQAEKTHAKGLDKSPRLVINKVSVKQKVDHLGKKPEKKGGATAKGPELKSPKNVRNARNKTADSEGVRSPRSSMAAKGKTTSDSDVENSPRLTRRSVSQAATTETQEPIAPRAVRKVSSQVVLDTPEPKSPSSLRSRPQRSIAETPERSTRKTVNKPPSDTLGSKKQILPKSQGKDVPKGNEKNKSAVPATTKTRAVTRTTSASLAKGRATRTGLGKTTSSDESSAVSSPDVPAAKKKKTGMITEDYPDPFMTFT